MAKKKDKGKEMGGIPGGFKTASAKPSAKHGGHAKKESAVGKRTKKKMA